MAEIDESSVVKGVRNWLDSVKKISLNTKPPKTNLYTNQERSSIIAMPNQLQQNSNRSVADLVSYMDKISVNTEENSRQNTQILEMVPELQQAVNQILIPSILSPNDHRPQGFIYTVSPEGIDEQTAEDISKLISKHFNETLKFKEKLPDWLRTAFWTYGAKVLLAIPISELDRKFNEKETIISTENFKTELKNIENTSIYGLNLPVGKEVEQTIVSGLESIFSSAMTQKLKAEKPEENKAYHAKLDKLMEAETRVNILKIATESINLVDNPDVLKLPGLQKKNVSKNQQKASKYYKQGLMVSLDTPIDSEDTNQDYPLFMEVPTSSVIPIYIPGAPSSHLGYFILIDEFGNPLKPDTSWRNDLAQVPAGVDKRSTFDNLYRAYGAGAIATMADLNTATITRVYKQIVEEHIKNRMEKIGYANIDIEKMNSVYQYMLSRYMQGRKTQLLYVPKEFVAYICDSYNEDGTGRSRLEDSKFILSIYITLLICSVHSSINASVDRRNLEIELGAGSDVAPDIVGFMRRMEEAFIQKNTLNISYNPTDISQSLARKSLTMQVKNMPGIDGFNISNTALDRAPPPVDTGLLESQLRSISLSQSVPPAAINQLGENEYSRSVATQNIMFARMILTTQTRTCAQVTPWHKFYLRYCVPLQKEILKIMGRGKDTDTQDGVVISNKNMDNDDAKILEKIFASLEISLPTPNIAPDQGHFEAIKPVLDNISSFIDMIYPEGVANLNEASSEEDVYKAMSALAKSEFVLGYVRKSGLLDNLDISKLDATILADLQDKQQQLLNFAEGMRKHYVAMKPGMAQPDAGDTGEQQPDNSQLDGLI